jgi:cellulose synthase/poly-beta-1,6-N-acetylglucosamine synthase-like glycosyltransferase
MLETIIIVVTALYIVQVIVFLFGTRRLRYPTNDQLLRDRPKVSVIVAALNEEANIRDCLDSLVHLDYPTDKLEIVIVNDRSTDHTPEIIREYTERLPHFKSIVTTPGVGELQGKANALAQGIEFSSGEVIMVTDADCTVPPSWVSETVKYYAEDTGMVLGFTLINPKSGFEAVQSLDWLFLLTIAAAGIALNRPLSCVGNNMTYRRRAYDQVGGYRNIKFSVTEDFSLLHAMFERTRWKIRFPINVRALVDTKPCPTWRVVYQQRQRWGTGGLDADFLGFYIMAVAFLLHVSNVIAPFFVGSILCWIISLLLKLVADAAILSIPLRRFRQIRLFKYFLHFELYFICYTILLPFIVFFGGRVRWKGRKY